MRTLAVFTLAGGLLFTNIAAQAADKTDLELIQGSWDVVAMEMNGRNMGDNQVKQLGMVLEIKDRTMTTTRDGKTESVSFVLRTGKIPKEIDTVDLKGEKKDQATLGIYAVDDDDNLKLCMRSGAKGRPAGFRTKASSGDMTLILKRKAGQ